MGRSPRLQQETTMPEMINTKYFFFINLSQFQKHQNILNAAQRTTEARFTVQLQQQQQLDCACC